MLPQVKPDLYNHEQTTGFIPYVSDLESFGYLVCEKPTGR